MWSSMCVLVCVVEVRFLFFISRDRFYVFLRFFLNFCISLCLSIYVPRYTYVVIYVCGSVCVVVVVEVRFDFFISRDRFYVFTFSILAHC